MDEVTQYGQVALHHLYGDTLPSNGPGGDWFCAESEGSKFRLIDEVCRLLIEVLDPKLPICGPGEKRDMPSIGRDRKVGAVGVGSDSLSAA